MIREANINLHHIDYDRIGNERFGDVVVICRGCHLKIHAFIDRMKRKGFKQRDVMQRLKPYCVRRLLAIHERYKDFK